MKIIQRQCVAALTAASLGWVSGCAGEARSDVDAPITGTAAAEIIGPNVTEVVVYDNPDLADDLPREVPVVVSFKDNKPDVVFQIGCGSNYGPLLEGFGYPRTLDLNQAAFYDSFDAMRAQIERDAGGQVPIHTLRCDANPNVTRQQIFQVYRRVDADMGKGEAEYYLRLRDDPGTIYSVGCSNVLSALSWTAADGSNIEQVSIPINRAVLDVWKAQEIATREINCHSSTGRALPRARRELPQLASERNYTAEAELYLVRYPFTGIRTRVTPYLIAGGKGYAIDCGSNADMMKQAFGFDPAATLEELSTSDPRFTASDPGRQPHLACDRNVKIFQTADQSPSARYFQLDGGKSLVRFTCPRAASFFAEGAPSAQSVPRAAVPYLFVDPNAPASQTRLLEVGCWGPGRARMAQLFFWVSGREPNDDELQYTATLYELNNSGGSPREEVEAKTMAGLASLVFAGSIDPLDRILDRAVGDGKRSNPRRTHLDGGRVFGEERTYFTNDINASRERAFRYGLYRWVNDRVANATPASRDELLASYDWAYGCWQTPVEVGPCPAPEGIAWWTGEFYNPANKDKSYTRSSLEAEHASYLKRCSDRANGCFYEIENVTDRACHRSGRPCVGDAAWADYIGALLRGNHIPGNYLSIICVVETWGNASPNIAACRKER
ncbi:MULTISPECIES: hypothetical protein [Sorangium]|uniref:Uncharacterized protein n=1 Tax=Sorangium cellulosum TaxID=56 RepID=A0A4V0NFA4_SORCE|nr:MULTISPECIES: hypothetical protein [Sorangium]AUX28982.1 uncharacterized protein SOCE836_010670 [Sorangium cellulosum]WCQ88376.1 hypothetical protein NQZ70_01052 [Sorangium sp. Soce836]